MRRSLSKSDRNILLETQKNKCFYCQKDLRSTLLGHPDDFNRCPDWACVDHRIPFSKGGPTDMINCVMACRRCNGKKGVKYG